MRAFLAAQHQTKQEDDVATPVDAAGRSVSSGDDYVDMDELIEAVQMRARLVAQNTATNQNSNMPNFYHQQAAPQPQIVQMVG